MVSYMEDWVWSSISSISSIPFLKKSLLGTKFTLFIGGWPSRVGYLVSENWVASNLMLEKKQTFALFLWQSEWFVNYSECHIDNVLDKRRKKRWIKPQFFSTARTFLDHLKSRRIFWRNQERQGGPGTMGLWPRCQTTARPSWANMANIAIKVNGGKMSPKWVYE